MTPWERFLLGCAGSIAVEVITIYRIYQGNPEKLPSRFRRGGYWVTRVLLVLVAGGLAWVYRGIDNPILAIHIGASAPLIIQAFAQRAPGELTE